LTADQVRDWGRYLESSPLYLHLIHVVADDDDLLRVLNRVEHTPRPNVLLAGVQYLMMGDPGSDLEAYFPNFIETPLPVTRIDPVFREFVLAHEDELVDIGRTRHTQTNECRRCVALLPGIWETGLDSFHLVDVGTSAGLNLALDHFRYEWDGVEWGPPSSVVLTTALRGALVTPRPLAVLSRTGLDLHPVDAGDPDDRAWLEALIWPEHDDRRRRLRAALEIAASLPIDLVAGDMLDTLGTVLAGLPAGDPAVVLNSFVLNQLRKQDRERVAAIVSDCRSTRDIATVSMEWLDPDAPGAYIEVDEGSGARRIGVAQPHGEWLELYDRP